MQQQIFYCKILKQIFYCKILIRMQGLSQYPFHPLSWTFVNPDPSRRKARIFGIFSYRRDSVTRCWPFFCSKHSHPIETAGFTQFFWFSRLSFRCVAYDICRSAGETAETRQSSGETNRRGQNDKQVKQVKQAKHAYQVL